MCCCWLDYWITCIVHWRLNERGKKERAQSTKLRIFQIHGIYNATDPPVEILDTSLEQHEQDCCDPTYIWHIWALFTCSYNKKCHEFNFWTCPHYCVQEQELCATYIPLGQNIVHLVFSVHMSFEKSVPWQTPNQPRLQSKDPPTSCTNLHMISSNTDNFIFGWDRLENFIALSLPWENLPKKRDWIGVHVWTITVPQAENTERPNLSGCVWLYQQLTTLSATRPGMIFYLLLLWSWSWLIDTSSFWEIGLT